VSIWSSIFVNDDPLLNIPERDNYNCEILSGVGSIDVATTWHECIRFCVDYPKDETQLLLTTDEARALIERLTTAIARVEVQE
jgi:hypothetical protein